ncbi:DUF4331 domain-containing protein [Micromonospora sp. NBC_01699]|uniref:DUF4331 family protein n=1 Tax=Micromonospora sp. NBC_01699 TaxID=2975984 RepID=UPI002E2D2DEB|nr:DUF4331 family protein [Micromonospora sp. NBC_01699]
MAGPDQRVLLPQVRRAGCARAPHPLSASCSGFDPAPRFAAFRHHLDTPLAAQTGQLYINDLYVFDGERGTVFDGERGTVFDGERGTVFDGERGTVFVMDVNSSITGADIKRGFQTEARYEIKVHFDGREMEELTYRVAFGEPDSDGRQPVTLHAVTGDQAQDDSATGTQVLEGRTGETVSGGNMRLWAGRIRDPFFIDLDQLATVNDAFKNGAKLDRSAWRPDKAQNTFAGNTVESIVLEVTGDGPVREGAQIGVWCRTVLATDAGGWRQVNRAGHPMMWPIFWPTDTDFSNPANFRHPCDDMRAGGAEIATAVASVVAANGTAPDPQAYGRSVAEQVYPDLLSYRVGSPANYGFAVRNGRTMLDNAPEVMLSLVLNTGMTSGLTSEATVDTRSAAFPYVVAA